MKSRIVLATIVAAVVALNNASASAAFSVTLTDQAANSQTFTIISPDGTIQVGRPGSGNPNIITNPGLLADFSSFNLVADPTASNATTANINTTQIQMSTAVTLTSLHVVVSDDFTTPTGPTMQVFNTLTLGSSDPNSGTLGGNQVTKITGVTATPAAVTLITGPTSGASSTNNLTFPASAPFTLTTDLVLTYSGAGFIGNITSSSTAVGAPTAVTPEPASLLVWGGLMTAGVLGVRRRRTAVCS